MRVRSGNGNPRVNLQAMPTQSEVISTDPEILAGEPVFAGTRVPLRNLFDYLEAGDSLEILTVPPTLVQLKCAFDRVINSSR